MPLWLKSWKVIAGIIIAVLFVGWLQLRSCQKDAQTAAEIGLHKGQQGALSNSAADAANTQGAANARERESEDLTRSNEREIRNAQGANQPVTPDANAAGLRALCRRAAYRDTERCRLLRAPAP